VDENQWTCEEKKGQRGLTQVITGGRGLKGGGKTSRTTKGERAKTTTALKSLNDLGEGGPPPTIQRDPDEEPRAKRGCSTKKGGKEKQTLGGTKFQG